jgi:hypothetical protein
MVHVGAGGKSAAFTKSYAGRIVICARGIIGNSSESPSHSRCSVPHKDIPVMVNIGISRAYYGEV